MACTRTWSTRIWQIEGGSPFLCATLAVSYLYESTYVHVVQPLVVISHVSGTGGVALKKGGNECLKMKDLLSYKS